MTILSLLVAAFWLMSLLAAIFTPAKKAKIANIIAFVATIAFAAIWSGALFQTRGGAVQASAMTTKVVASCATIEPGQAEAAVRARLGAPSEVRNEEELRGPGANVWLYRDSRCAVHFLEGAVETID